MLSRAVLEDLAHGSGPVCSVVCSHDSSQHLPGCLCLQECQIRPQAQVRMPISFLFSLSLLGFVNLISSLDCIINCYPFRVAQKREDAVSKEVTRKLSEADNRKMSRKEKDERYSS